MSNATAITTSAHAEIRAWLNDMIAKHVVAPAPEFTAVPEHVPAKWVEEVDAARAAELAVEAATHIEERGWWQGGYYGPGGKVCAMGALMDVTGMRPRYYDALWREAARIVGSHVPAWNDEPERTANEVIDMWLEVAARFEARAK